MQHAQTRDTGPPAAPADPSGLKVLIADDHHLVREGLRLAVRHLDPDAQVTEAETLAAAIAAYRADPGQDLVLLDLSMPDGEGLDLLLAFERECPDARVVIVSASYDLATVREALRHGVLGFIPKLSGRDAVLHALRFILDGGIYAPPEAFALATVMPHDDAQAPQPAAAAEATRAKSPRDMGLTARQIDVLMQLLEGKSNKQICRDMNLAMGTVKGHVAAILAALDVSSRAEAISAAARLGWHRSFAD